MACYWFTTHMIPPPGLSRLSVNISITAFAISLPPTASTPTFFTYNLHKVLGNSVSSPPLFAHYFETKWTGGRCLLASCICPHSWVPCNAMRNIDNHNHCRQFLEEQQLRWTCTMGISGACVDTKLRSIKATCIVSSMWQGTILVQRATKNLSLANEHAYCDLCVCIYKHTRWWS